MNPVLTRIRASLAARNEKDKTPYPNWKPETVVSAGRLAHGSLVDCFEANFAAANGLVMRQAAELGAYLGKANQRNGYCDPALESAMSEMTRNGVTFSTTYDRSRYDEYDFGITRATGAIAESGSIILRDSETSARLGALTPWIHVAVVEQQTIVRTIGDAIAAFGDDPNVIWVTGPSKTADVEGILIEGVHGPGVQIALIV